MAKPILCLDFDGVVHSYTSRWAGPDIVVDLPTDGAQAALERYLSHFDVHIFSSRSHQPGGLEAMQQWMADHFDPLICAQIGWPVVKPPAMVTLDDRALTFKGHWPTLDELIAFRPWNKP